MALSLRRIVPPALLRSILALLLAIPITSCSRPYESAALGVRFSPPSGMAVQEERAGPPATTHFGEGLELRSIEQPPPAEGEVSVDALLEAAGLIGERTLLSARDGTLPAGKVMRYEFSAGAERELIYFLRAEKRFLLVRYHAPKSIYGQMSSRVERALSSIELTR